MRVPDIRFAAYFLAIFICHSASLNADLRMTYSIRRLVIDADSIVIAEPVESQPGVMPDRYRVLEALHSADIKVGDEVQAWKPGLPELSAPKFGRRPEDEESPEIDKALLFIFKPGPDAPATNDGSVRVEIRALSKSGKTLVPQQPFTTEDPLHMLPRKGTHWEDIIAKVRAELPEINRVKAMREIPDAKERNQALLAWVEEHKAEFGGGHFDGNTKGWATFETKLFDWIYQTCIPEDCWRAVEFSVETHSSVWMHSPSFCSPEGRKLLLSKVLDERLANPLRRQAMELLSSSCFWPQRDDYPSIVIASPEEQIEILDQVVPLLTHSDRNWRIAAVRCVSAASSPHDGNRRHLETKRAIPALTKLYATERDVHVRVVLAETLRTLGDEFSWSQVSGNPRGMVVLARLSETRPDELEFTVSFHYTRTQRTLPPVLKMEQRNEQGEVGISRLVYPITKYAKNRAMQDVSTWIERGALTIPTNQIEPGLWRLTFEGQTDEGELWHSEPMELTIPVN